MLYFNNLHGIVKNHMYKKHWNTVYIDGTIMDREFFEWIDHSYALVRGKHNL